MKCGSSHDGGEWKKQFLLVKGRFGHEVMDFLLCYDGGGAGV
jgi:hypothetical protein